MNNGHGGARTGAGRKQGTLNKMTQKARDEAAQAGLMPLDFMLSLLRDEKADFKDRMWAAEKAAPFLHPKLSSVEYSGPDGEPIDHRVNYTVDQHTIETALAKLKDIS